MSLFFIRQHIHCSCQDLPAFDWNSEYSQLVTNNSRKSSNYCCTCGLIAIKYW